MERGTDISELEGAYWNPKEGDLPEKIEIELARDYNLKYGTNPHQEAKIYKIKRIDNTAIDDILTINTLKIGKGGISATNYLDFMRAFDILKFFEEPSVAVMKHLIPSGFATQWDGEPLDQIYLDARNCDKQSAFGSTVVSNRPIDKATAEAILGSHVDLAVAPDFEEGVVEMFQEDEKREKIIRVLSYDGVDKLPKFDGDDRLGAYAITGLSDGRVLIEEPYLSRIKGPDDFITDASLVHEKTGKKVVIERDPNPNEFRDLLTAWYVNIGVRSNGMVIVKDGRTVAVGTGQQERYGAMINAMVKAYQKAMDRQGDIGYNALNGAHQRFRLKENPLLGASVASDGFIPFDDAVLAARAEGITAIAEPGGSKNSYFALKAAGKRMNIKGVKEKTAAYVITTERSFAHF